MAHMPMKINIYYRRSCEKSGDLTGSSLQTGAHPTTMRQAWRRDPIWKCLRRDSIPQGKSCGRSKKRHWRRKNWTHVWTDFWTRFWHWVRMRRERNAHFRKRRTMILQDGQRKKARCFWKIPMRSYRWKQDVRLLWSEILRWNPDIREPDLRW